MDERSILEQKINNYLSNAKFVQKENLKQGLTQIVCEVVNPAPMKILMFCEGLGGEKRGAVYFLKPQTKQIIWRVVNKNGSTLTSIITLYQHYKRGDKVQNMSLGGHFSGEFVGWLRGMGLLGECGFLKGEVIKLTEENYLKLRRVYPTYWVKPTK